MPQVPSDVATHRVAWPSVGQVMGYYGSYAEAKRECDASREYDRTHNQGGPHAVVQKYDGDGEWVTVYPKKGRPDPKRRGEKYSVTEYRGVVPILKETSTATHAYVLLREVGKKRWLYLDGKGGEAATRVRAARYPIEKAAEIAKDIVDDNPGTWEAKVLPIE